MSIYAVIQTGGKQYRVQPGDIIEIEKLPGDVGAAVNFDQVLFVAKPSSTEGQETQIWLGKPMISGASVGAEIVGQGRDTKILIVKKKRRKQYRRTIGHRQEKTQVLVVSLDSGAGEKAVLSAEDKKTKLATFQSHLTERGSAFTAPILKRRLPIEQAKQVKEIKQAKAIKRTAKKAAAAAKRPVKKKSSQKKTSTKKKSTKKA